MSYLHFTHCSLGMQTTLAAATTDPSLSYHPQAPPKSELHFKHHVKIGMYE